MLMKKKRKRRLIFCGRNIKPRRNRLKKKARIKLRALNDKKLGAEVLEKIQEETESKKAA
jgi:hypothetical protein